MYLEVDLVDGEKHHESDANLGNHDDKVGNDVERSKTSDIIAHHFRRSLRCSAQVAAVNS